MDVTTGEFKKSLEKTTFLLKEDLKTIRTGQANPALIENLVIETYGGETKLKLLELASITTEGPGALVIMPFDPSIIADIEKGILKSPLGFSPQVQGTKIMVRIPPLSQEQREKMTKLIGQKIEEKRSIIRNLRDEVRKKVKNQFELKTITEDQKYRLEKEIDSIAQKCTSDIQVIREEKEKEIMEV